jgi:hypothetical protein
MMRWCAIGFVAGIAASIGWHLAPHGAHSQPIVPVAIAATATAPAPVAPPSSTFDVAPLVVTTAAPTAETVVAGLARARAPRAAAPRAQIVVRRAAAPAAAPASAAAAAAAPAPAATAKDDEIARARKDYAAASAELGAAL